MVAEEAQHFADNTGDVAGFDAAGAGLLAEFFASGIHGYRQVQVARARVAEQVLQVLLAWCGIVQVHAADDVGDALFGIIDDHGQLVGEQAIGAASVAESFSPTTYPPSTVPEARWL